MSRKRKTKKTNPAAIALNARIRTELATGKATAYVPNGVGAPLFTTGNGKTGLAFTLPEGSTCPGKTAACAATCYLNFGSFIFPASRNSRNRNFALVLKALAKSPEALAAVLTAQLRMAANGGTWQTCRVHDGGDFFSPAYVRAWQIVARNNPGIQFWAYTRSWAVPAIFAELVELAALPNFSLWLSLDHDNFEAGMVAYDNHADVLAGIAFMELPEDMGLATQLAVTMPRERLVIFPAHRNGGKFDPATVIKTAPNCPAIVDTEKFPHDKKAPACLACRKCLPAQTTV